MYYTLKMTHYNTSANVFFETAAENYGLITRFSEICQSINEKNNVEAGTNHRIETYGQDQTGTYIRTTLQLGFVSAEDVENRFNDMLNSSFWQENIFEWNKNNNVKSRHEILDENGNMVKLLHDNRGISVQGSGPSAWAPYVPLENV